MILFTGTCILVQNGRTWWTTFWSIRLLSVLVYSDSVVISFSPYEYVPGTLLVPALESPQVQYERVLVLVPVLVPYKYSTSTVSLTVRTEIYVPEDLKSKLVLVQTVQVRTAYSSTALLLVVLVQVRTVGLYKYTHAQYCIATSTSVHTAPVLVYTVQVWVPVLSIPIQ